VLYRLTRAVVRLGLRAYFREVEVRGAENLPAEGPCIVAANHFNSMIDPFLLLAMLHRPLCFIAKAPLFKVPILGWLLRRGRCIPAYRSQDAGYAKEKNDALYAAAAEALGGRPALAIFPEGKSHSEPHLAEFRHGASKIALETESLRGGVRIQLIGIHYERTRGFRGRVLIQLGPPIAAAEYIDRYRADARATTAALTEELQSRLSEMILTAETREVLRLADLLARMRALQEKGRPHQTGEAFDRKKLILERYRLLRERVPDEVERLRRQLSRYEQMLAQIGVNEEQVGAEYSIGRVVSSALVNTLLVTVALPFLAVGIVLNVVPYLIAWIVSRVVSPLPDRRASAAFLTAFVAFPLAWTAIGILVGRQEGAASGVLCAVLAGFFGAISLRAMDRWHQVLLQTWGLWMAVARPGARALLRRMRGRALARADRLLELVTGENPAAAGSP
jgi:glycerol-3-phosphate O-acyltransferase / dihydroxyacetone phosphate acyltransferase